MALHQRYDLGLSGLQTWDVGSLFRTFLHEPTALQMFLTSHMSSDTPNTPVDPDAWDVLLLVEGQSAMKRPEKLQLSREDGEALRTRLAGDVLTADDRRVLDQVLQWYFWLLFALQEATFSLKRSG